MNNGQFIHYSYRSDESFRHDKYFFQLFAFHFEKVKTENFQKQLTALIRRSINNFGRKGTPCCDSTNPTFFSNILFSIRSDIG